MWLGPQVPLRRECSAAEPMVDLRVLSFSILMTDTTFLCDAACRRCVRAHRIHISPSWRLGCTMGAEVSWCLVHDGRGKSSIALFPVDANLVVDFCTGAREAHLLTSRVDGFYTAPFLHSGCSVSFENYWCRRDCYGTLACVFAFRPSP